MIVRVSEYTNRSNFVRDLSEHLPIYLITDSFEDIMVVKHISKRFFRDIEPESINGHSSFKEDSWRQPIMSDHIVCTSKEEAEHYIKMKKAENILLDFDMLEKKYLTWKKFREENPQYFV